MAVSTHTKNIANSEYVFAVFTSFAVSIFWIFNVSTIAKGDMLSKILYIIGAALGAISGIAFHDFFLS